MEIYPHTSDLPSNNYLRWAKELLSRTEKLEFSLYKESSNETHFWMQTQDGQPKTIVCVVTPEGNYLNNIDDILSSIKYEVVATAPTKYILICFFNLYSNDLNKLKSLADKFLNTEFLFHGIEWIRDQLHQHKDLAEKYIIKLSDESIPNKSESVDPMIPPKIQEEKDYFLKKYDAIIHDPGFYFQKAIDVLDQLKSYNETNISNNESKSKVDIYTLVSPYVELESIWNNRGNVKPSEFAEYLEKQQPELVPLFILISKFISYIDTNAWNKKDLNEYPDKRCIARTGLNQAQLVDQFLQYALNNFELIPENADKVFYRALAYLQTPQAVFNILSETHRILISNYFLGAYYTGSDFHNKLRDYFDSLYGFSVKNPKNVTCIYAFIIYSSQIRKLWDVKHEDDIEETPTPKQQITQLTSSAYNNNDLAHGEQDLLGFEPDVKVLAALMALKKMDPPLAIALFGKWGTGKSFFMYHLEKKINELAKYQGFLESKETTGTKTSVLDGDKYCRGIAQIKFNAWSYIDSNLWAGLVNTIFEKLNEYITEGTKSGVAKLQVQRKLSERLIALKTQKVTEEGKKNHLVKLKEGFKKESEKLENNIVQNIGNEILEISKSNENIKKAYDGLFTKNESFGKNFTISDTKLFSEYNYWKNFWTNCKKSTQLLQYVVLVVVGVIAAILIVNYLKLDFKFIYSLPVFSILGKAITWWKLKQSKIKKYVDKFNALVENNTEIQEKVANLENKIKMVDEQKKLAQKQIEELEDQIQKVQHSITDNLTEAAINDFIGNRAKHKDYQDHLGIVSTIRRDFETLSELFQESKGDEETSEKSDLETSKNDLLQEDRKFIKEQFEEGKKLERIILYIDDLDRCSDEKVLEVLQAVHLLMAFPLFIVVVGVDKRCVNNALNHKNILQYFNSTGARSLKQLKEEFNIEIIQPNDYLEKIFQIPFQIPDAGTEGVQKMIEYLFKGQIKEIEPEEERKDESKKMAIPETKLELQPISSELRTTQMNIFLEETEEATNKETPAEDIVKKEDVKEKEYIPVTPPDLTITPVELEQIKNLSGLVGNSPRTIKRFVNLYRILRAHSELSHNTLPENKKLAIMFALSINVGENKQKAAVLFKSLKNKNSEPLKEVITETQYPDIYKELTKNNLKNILDITCNDVNSHLEFIKRFSFGEIVNGDNNLKSKAQTN